LQFLSWLFEGALSHCMSDTSQTACEELKARESRRSSPRPAIDQSRSVCKSVRKSSRKGMPWSTEEVDLLVKLRKDEGRSWSDVTRVLSKQYPGRSQGAIQVYWCTTLSKKAS
jgi:chitinase